MTTSGDVELACLNAELKMGMILAPDILGMIVHSPVYAPTASSAANGLYLRTRCGESDG